MMMTVYVCACLCVCVQVTLWLHQIGEVQLQAFEEHEDSLELLIKKQLNFKDFYTTAYV